MKRMALSVILFIIAMISMRAVYNRATAPTTPTAFILDDMVEGREGPDERYLSNARLLSVYRYPVTGRDSTGTWWQLDVNGGSSWVYESNVSVVSVENVPIVATPCVTVVSPRCPAEQHTTTVTAEFFEDGIILQISYQTYVLILPHYGNSEYGYISTYPSVWGETPSERNLDTYRASLGSMTADTITYTTTLEVYTGSLSPHDNVTYVRLPDGRGIGYDVLSGHWFIVE